MKILIPAYEPSENFIILLRDVKANCEMETVIVDDGSGESYADIFRKAEELGCIVLHHPRNMGKGAALKTGFQYLIDNKETEGVVCADCDGQHAADDICRVAAETLLQHKAVVLGVRQFTGQVPLKSRLGNSLTRWVFSLSAGYKIQDTQTGLRGYPATMLEWLCKIDGTRFEYELNILLELKAAGYSVKEIAIQTIYENGNKSSHFRPFVDSIRVYIPFLKFSASSMSAGLLDFILLLCFQSLFRNLLVAVVFSRVISSVFNYCCNKYIVFSNRKQKNFQTAPKYFLLVSGIMLLNYILLNYITALGLNLVIAKIITETVLFVLSYIFQKKVVFAVKKLA